MDKQQESYADKLAQEALDNYIKLEIVGYLASILEKIYTEGTRKQLDVQWNDKIMNVEGKTYEFIKNIINIKDGPLKEYTAEDFKMHYRVKACMDLIKIKESN